MTTVKIVRVKLDRQGYDRRGNYWGTGPRLYCAEIDDGETLRYVHTRAHDYQGVRAWYKEDGAHVLR
jgi:hypothetical protein